MPPPVHVWMPVRCLLCLFLLPLASHAADGVWSNVGGGSWSGSSNWSAGTPAEGNSAQADFSQLDLLSATTVTLNGTRTAGFLKFGDISPSHDWSIRRGSSGSLTLEASTGTPNIEVMNRTATLGVDLLGSKGLTKSGAGTLVLSGSNTYSGPTVIQAGTLRLAPPPLFPTGMKVMPLGDSITYGYNGSNAGYRSTLYGMLQPLAPTFQYVGTSTERPGFLPPNQQHHEGHSSYAVQDLSNNLDGLDTTIYQLYGGPDRDPNGGFWITGGGDTGRGPMIPDVITLMAGTNDLDEPVGFQERLTGLISKLNTLCPDAKILLARITPITNSEPVDVPALNAMIDQVTNDFRTAGKPVFPVDLNTTFPASGLISDGTHPNDTGFSWMAMQWYEGIIKACTPSSGISGGLPTSTSVTVASGATLDIAGNQSSIASLNAAGAVSLGNGGNLATTAGMVLKASGTLLGSGTIQGPVILNGYGFAHADQSLVFTGAVTLNGSLLPGTGANLVFMGNFVNNGVVQIPPGVTVSFGGDVINNGVIRCTDGAALMVSGILQNNGTLDILTGSQTLPAGIIDNGWIIGADEVAVHSTAIENGGIRVSIDSYSGHVYQLQRSSTLADGSWIDVGEGRDGVTGVRLDFEHPLDSPTGRDFFRIRVSP